PGARVSRTRMDAGRRSPAIGQPEREPPQDHGNHRGGGVEDRQADPGVLEWPGAERGDAVADLKKAITPPAMEADLTVSCSCPKLIVRGSRAEQPRPARPNAGTPNPGAPCGSAAMSANAPAATKGRAR